MLENASFFGLGALAVSATRPGAAYGGNNRHTAALFFVSGGYLRYAAASSPHDSRNTHNHLLLFPSFRSVSLNHEKN